MLQILYEADHLNRGRTLSEVIEGSDHGLVTMEPVKKKGLETLLFWGHSGGNLTLCGKRPGELATLVKRWKTLNPGLKTVEVNLLHHQVLLRYRADDR